MNLRRLLICGLLCAQGCTVSGEVTATIEGTLNGKPYSAVVTKPVPEGLRLEPEQGVLFEGRTFGGEEIGALYYDFAIEGWTVGPVSGAVSLRYKSDITQPDNHPILGGSLVVTKATYLKTNELELEVEFDGKSVAPEFELNVTRGHAVARTNCAQDDRSKSFRNCGDGISGTYDLGGTADNGTAFTFNDCPPELVDAYLGGTPPVVMTYERLSLKNSKGLTFTCSAVGKINSAHDMGIDGATVHCGRTDTGVKAAGCTWTVTAFAGAKLGFFYLMASADPACSQKFCNARW